MKFEVDKFFRPHFLVAVVILGLAAAGFQLVFKSFNLFFSKAELPLRTPLYLLAGRFGPYELESEEPALTPEIEAVLGAHAYITREYYDTRRLQKSDPGAIIRLHVAYFTGTPDPVIHVPEVCYIAAGAQGLKKDFETVVLDASAWQANADGSFRATTGNGSEVSLPQREISLLAFDFAGERSGEAVTVTYFFAANGQFTGTTGIRKLVFDIRDRYAYWCKIEVLPMGINDRQAALQAVGQFLTHALPEIMLCLPDWAAVKAGTFPPSSAVDASQRQGESVAPMANR